MSRSSSSLGPVLFALLSTSAALSGCAVDVDRSSSDDGLETASAKDDSARTTTSFDLEGTNVFVPEGSKVTAWFDWGFGATSSMLTGTVVDERFSLHWDDGFPIRSFGVTTNVWIDADSDGECSARDTKLAIFISTPSWRTVDGAHETVDVWRASQENAAWCEDFDRDRRIAEHPVDCDVVCGGARYSKGCFRDEACLDFCWSRVSAASQVIQDTFEMCALTNPLCYQRAGDCVERGSECLATCAAEGRERTDCLAECRFGAVTCVADCTARGTSRDACVEECISF